MELIQCAERRGIDTQREECVIWMSDEYSKYAAWDQNNIEENIKHFAAYDAEKGSNQDFKTHADSLATNLASFERREIIAMLDDAAATLNREINGEISRRAVKLFDWSAINPNGDQYNTIDREAIYIHDYFSKPDDLNNEYCGYLDRASIGISSLDSCYRVNKNVLRNLKENQTGKAGYVMLWHGFPASWAVDQDPLIMDGKRLFTLYDIDNPIVRKSWNAVIKQCVPQFINGEKSANGASMGYILSNEPHWYTSKNSWATGGVSDYTIEKFKVWLKSKHTTIENLNQLWNTNFVDFDNIEFTLPFDAKMLHGSAQSYDWQLFNMTRVNDWFTELHDNIRSIDNSATTHIKLMPHCWTDDHRDHGLDFEYLTNLTEVSGNDAQIYKQMNWGDSNPWWEKRYAMCWNEIMAYDFFKSVKPDQPIFNSEGHFLSTSRYRELDMSPQYIRSAFWLSTLHGMNVCMSWFWARDTNSGAPHKGILGANSKVDNAMGKAYAGSVAQQPRVANEVAQVYMDLNAFSDEVSTFQGQERPIRIFYSETSAICKKDHMSNAIFPLYESLYFEGLLLGFATEGIIEKEPVNSWQLLVVYKTEFVKDDEFEALQNYLNQGGVVIIDEISLTKDEYGRERNTPLKESNGTIIYANSLDAISYATCDNLGDYRPKYILEESNSVGLKGCEWRIANNNIMYIINLGASAATLSIKDSTTNQTIGTRNMMTGELLDNQFTLYPEGVLLLQLNN